MTPTLISAFLTYTLITALTPGPNNILALSSVTSHGLRRSLRVLAGMSVGFIITMLICAALTFSLVELDSRFTLVLGWIGALGNLCWALAGHLFQRLFLLYGRQLNWMLAALLVYCAVRIVVE